MLQQLCRDLRLLWTEAGGPSLRKLSAQVGLSKSQVGAILNGDVRRLPDWDVIKRLVESFRRYAQDRGRVPNISLRTGLDEYWRPRYSVLEYAFRHVPARVLRGAPQAARPTDRAPAPVVPRQLPPAVRHFTGRAAELEALTGLLDQTDPAGRGVTIATIDGTAGVGKSTLAVCWAHRVAERFGDGQLYVNLRGFDPTGSPLSPAEAVRGFLDALHVPPQRVPASVAEQTSLYRSLLAGKRVLVVLDNARDADQVRPLLPGSPGCLVLVTSRNRLPDLVAIEGAYPLTLDLLTPAEARDMLTDRLGRAAHPRVLDELGTWCARLPLALAMVAARAATQPRLSLDRLAAELREAGADLDALADWETAIDVRAVFSWSYRTLGAGAARLFRLLGLHPGPDIAAPAAASLARLPLARVRPLLAELTRANLLAQPEVGRYTFHDLLRAYAAELVHAHDGENDRRMALHRMLDHYTHSADAAACRLEPSRDHVVLAAPQPGAIVEHPVDSARAMEWLTAERAVLLKAVERAADTGFDRHAWQIAWTLARFLDRRGHWQELAKIHRIALAATRRAADEWGQATMLRFLALTECRLGRHADAHAHVEGALEIFGRLGDTIGLANTHREKSRIYAVEGRHAEALHHAQLALDLHRAAGHRVGQARTLNLVGWNRAKLGDHHRAIASCQRAAGLLEEIGDRLGLAHALDSLGYSHHHLGHYQQAVGLCQRALDVFQEIGSRYDEAGTLIHLGDAQHSAGDHDRARVSWQRAADILAELDHSDAGMVRGKLAELEPPTPDPKQEILARLTRRETQIAELVCEGLTNREIAGKLLVAEKTVEMHLSRVFVKLGVRNRVSVVRVVERGIPGVAGRAGARDSPG